MCDGMASTGAVNRLLLYLLDCSSTSSVKQYEEVKARHVMTPLAKQPPKTTPQSTSKGIV